MGQNETKISPKVKISDIFGQDLILNPRPPFSNYGWLPKNPAIKDFLTGPPLTVVGDLPVICNYSVITGEVLSLLEKANLEVAPNNYVYRTEKDYKNLLDYFKRQKRKLVFNHVHPPNELDRELYWIDPKLISYLNNKANLDKIVSSNYVPLRVTTPLGEIRKVTNELVKLPLVIKAATNQSTAGGYDIIICRDTKDIDRACKYFSNCKTVIVEEFIEIDKIFNTQFAATVHGQIIYLGTSEQISNPSGNYLGNWIFKNNEPPKLITELGRSIMECACLLGFYGIGGFDIAISKDNRVLAIDLNFRFNGSTPALLLRDSIMRIHNASALLLRTWNANIKWNRFFSICKEFIESKYLIPLSIYDSVSSPYSNSTPCFTGVLVGSSREDILKKVSLLTKHGIT